MTQQKKVKIGIAGTSWWADSMYLPALSNHPHAEIVAVLGRNAEYTKEFAEKWNIPAAFTDLNQFIEDSDIDAIIIATADKSHYPIAMKALKAHKHVLCEKPLGLSLQEATEMTELAHKHQLITMVPFTYRYMPLNQYTKNLLDQGFIGEHLELNMRYYASFGRNKNYSWRFDQDQGGSGALGDIGSHFFYLAYWFFGEISEVYCELGFQGQRTDKNLENRSYRKANDTAKIILRFKSGATGVLHISSLSYEDQGFKQEHSYELIGTEGKIKTSCDWYQEQSIKATRVGHSPISKIPDEFLEDIRMDNVHDTYRDVFRYKDNMAREFISAVFNLEQIEPSFDHGKTIQKYIEAALKSHELGSRVKIP